MKIGIDARMYGAESTTGICVYIQKLTEKLFSIDEKNEYYLFLKEPAFSQFKPPTDRVKKIKTEIPWYNYSEQIKLPRLLNKYKLDLVHFPHFNVPIFYQGKFIVTIHDITPKFFPGPKVKKSLLRRLAYNLVLNQALEKSKRIITVSQYTKNNLTKYFDIDSEKIEIIYPGIGEEFKKIDSSFEEIIKKYNITKPFLFYIGVWRDHKNLPGLIKSFEILKSKYNQDYQLVLGGKPDPRYPEIQQAIEYSKFKNDIITPGFIPEDELPLFYNAAKLFVLSSFAEGFGLVAVESLACGTPVVSSNTTSLPEVLKDSTIYFNPKDPLEIAKAIDQVLNDHNLYQNLITKGLILAREYNWRSCAQKTLAVYQESIN